MADDFDCRGRRSGAVIAGVILLVLGISMLLDTTGVFAFPVRRLFAPLVLIVIGTVIIADRRPPAYRPGDPLDDETRRRSRLDRRHGASGGYWLIGIGVWMMASQLHVFGLDYGNSWPLFIILSGVLMLMRGMK